MIVDNGTTYSLRGATCRSTVPLAPELQTLRVHLGCFAWLSRAAVNTGHAEVHHRDLGGVGQVAGGIGLGRHSGCEHLLVA